MISLLTPAPVSATCVVGLISLMSGCAHNDKRVECSGRDALLQAVFNYQFANNRSSIGKDAATYFIGLENGQDPDEDFLRRFEEHLPPVEPLSMAGTAGQRVVDSRTGNPALIFQIRKVTETETGGTLVETGYYEAELSASWNTLRGICEGGEWQIDLIGPEILS